MDYILVILVAVVVISVISLLFMYLSKKKPQPQMMMQQQMMPQQMQQPQSQVLRAGANHQLYAKIEEEKRKFRESQNPQDPQAQAPETVGQVGNPNYKKDYQEIYQNLQNEMAEKKIKEEEQDKLQAQKFTPAAKQYDESVDNQHEIDHVYYANIDGTRGKRNIVDDKLDKQLYWKKQSKIVFGMMIFSSVILLIMLYGG